MVRVVTTGWHRVVTTRGWCRNAGAENVGSRIDFGRDDRVERWRSR
jgi:hypothetical protein